MLNNFECEKVYNNKNNLIGPGWPLKNGPNFKVVFFEPKYSDLARLTSAQKFNVVDRVSKLNFGFCLSNHFRNIFFKIGTGGLFEVTKIILAEISIF